MGLELDELAGARVDARMFSELSRDPHRRGEALEIEHAAAIDVLGDPVEALRVAVQAPVKALLELPATVGDEHARSVFRTLGDAIEESVGAQGPKLLAQLEGEGAVL
jgi:hypothetical protein